METKIKDFLINNKIEYKLIKHEPLFTCTQAKKLNLPGISSKSLFVKDKNKNFYLIILPADKKLDSNKFAKKVKGKKIRFSTSEELEENLKLKPGSVSPLGLIHNNKIPIYIDKDVWEAKTSSFHPNDNTMSLIFSKEMFQKMIRSLKNNLEICEF